jgi:hypothetical protein
MILVEVYRLNWLTSPINLSFWVELVSASTLTWYQSHSNMVSKPEVSSSNHDRGFICASTHLFPRLRFSLWLHVSGGVEVYK